jgi:serine/threonine-protein kinase RsbW
VDPSHPIVEFSFPPDPLFVRVARLVTGDMAERSGFSVDELDDVRLAVDELCALLIGADGPSVQLRLQAVDGELVIEAKTAGAGEQAVPSDLSEMLLRALVDSCTFDSSAHETSVVMRKQARDLR